MRSLVRTRPFLKQQHLLLRVLDGRVSGVDALGQQPSTASSSPNAPARCLEQKVGYDHCVPGAVLLESFSYQAFDITQPSHAACAARSVRSENA